MSTHLVTVIIPVFNAGGYLVQAVGSILSQTHRDLEVIIVDDGSTDGCIDSLDGITDSRVRIIRQENAGKSAAVNRAIDSMNGEFWMVQDADDISHPERVERQLAALVSDSTLAAVFCGVELLIGGRSMARQIEGKDRNSCRHAIDGMHMPAHDATGMYRMSLIGDYRYDPDLRIGEGFDLIMRIGEEHPIEVLPDCLYSHRVVASSLTHSCPAVNVDQINRAIAKTCRRRNIDPAPHLHCHRPASRWFRHREIDTVISYAMTSVAQHKRRGMMAYALKTSLQCAMLHPFDPIYYRPLARFLVPESALRVMKGSARPNGF